MYDSYVPGHGTPFPERKKQYITTEMLSYGTKHFSLQLT